MNERTPWYQTVALLKQATSERDAEITAKRWKKAGVKHIETFDEQVRIDSGLTETIWWVSGRVDDCPLTGVWTLGHG